MATVVLALLVAAVVLDRVAATVGRDRDEAEAAATFEAIRAAVSASRILDADPVAAGALPHIPARRGLTITHTDIPGGTDRVTIDWSGLPDRAALGVGNRVGAWLGRDRPASPLTLDLDEIPLPYPRRVLRGAPSMQARLETAGIANAGVVEAAQAEWAEAETADGRLAAAADDGGVVVTDAAVASVTAAGLAVAGGLGAAGAPVVLTVGTPPAGEAAVRVANLTADTLAVAGRAVANQVTVATTTDADALVVEDDQALDLAGAGFGDVTLFSARSTAATATRVEVGVCYGCN